MKQIEFGKLKPGQIFWITIAGIRKWYEKIEPTNRNRYNMRNVKTGQRGHIGGAAIVKIK